jgi:hypothetical protein
MTSSVMILALFGIELPKSNRSMGKLPGLLLSDILIIVGLGLGLLLVLGAAVYLWTKLRRKRRRHVSGGQKVYRGASNPDDTAAEHNSAHDEHEEDHEPHHHHQEDDENDDHHSQGRRRYKYRVRRRSHRTRNPTLSEVGGLPPVKTQEPTKPF